TQSEIQSEAPRNLPIVLDIRSIVILLIPGEERIVRRSLRNAQQESRERVAAGGVGLVPHFLRVARVGIEGQNVAGVLDFVIDLADIEARFDGVRSCDL